MPLLTLKTDLTSLKYGMDRPGGGKSEQPFIVKDIPGKDKSFDKQIDDERTGLYGMTVGNDFGFRNALLNAAINGGDPLEDNKRILDLYFKTTTGLVFEAKQVAIGLAAGQDMVWNPLAIQLQELANVVGVGHVPAFISPSYKPFQNPLANPFPNVAKLQGFGAKDKENKYTGEGKSKEDFYGMNNPAEGTNRLFKSSIQASRVSRDNYALGTRNIISKEDKGKADTFDKMAMVPLYNSLEPTPPELKDAIPNDMINFVISVVDNNNPSKRTWIRFRAFIDSFGDNYSAKWNGDQYIGRGEEVYRYGGFGREVSMGFTIAVQSKDEQQALYNKLNYLVSSLAPDYDLTSGFMRGNYVYMTVGNWLVDVPGVIKGINLQIPKSSPWEIGRKPDGSIDNTVGQLPHVVQVTGLQFTPIHNFVPSINKSFIGFNGSRFAGGSIQNIGIAEPVQENNEEETLSTYDEIFGPETVEESQEIWAADYQIPSTPSLDSISSFA